ncbi:MAG: outer membrane beta-barrel protein [Planctomycetota bacterium]
MTAIAIVERIPPVLLFVLGSSALAGAQQAPAGQADPPPTVREQALEERVRALEERLRSEPGKGGEPTTQPTETSPIPHWVSAALERVEVHGVGAGGYTYDLVDPRVRRGALLTRVSDLDHDTFSPTFFKLGLTRRTVEENEWDAGLRVEVAAGTMVGDTLSADPQFLGGDDINLANAYVELQMPAPWGRPLRARVGRSYGWFSLDSLDLYDAPLYSMSWFGNYSPFTNTGVFLETELLPGLSYMQYVGNGAEVVVDNNDSKTVGGKLCWTPSDRLSLVANWIWGAERPENEHDARWMVELDATWQAASATQMLVMLRYGQEEGQALSGGTAKFGGASLCVRQGLISAREGEEEWQRLSIIGRGTWFRDQGGVNSGLDQALYEGTVGLELRPVSCAWLRIEYRFDLSSRANAFLGHRGGQTRRHQDTITIGVSCAF